MSSARQDDHTQLSNKSAQLASKGLGGLAFEQSGWKAKPNVERKLAALGELPNPIRGMAIYSNMPDCPLREVKHEYIWQLFQHSLQNHELELALALLQKKHADDASQAFGRLQAKQAEF